MLGIKLARKNLAIYVHSHSAILVKGGKVIGFGVNRYENGMHAEVSVIMKNRKSNLRGCDMYVARALRHTPCGLSKPCEECQKVIKDYGINKVYYTVDDYSKLYEELVEGS